MEATLHFGTNTAIATKKVPVRFGVHGAVAAPYGVDLWPSTASAASSSAACRHRVTSDSMKVLARRGRRIVRSEMIWSDLDERGAAGLLCGSVDLTKGSCRLPLRRDRQHAGRAS
jgi:hypothetical protein